MHYFPLRNFRRTNWLQETNQDHQTDDQSTEQLRAGVFRFLWKPIQSTKGPNLGVLWQIAEKKLYRSQRYRQLGVSGRYDICYLHWLLWMFYWIRFQQAVQIRQECKSIIVEWAARTHVRPRCLLAKCVSECNCRRFGRRIECIPSPLPSDGRFSARISRFVNVHHSRPMLRNVARMQYCQWPITYYEKRVDQIYVPEHIQTGNRDLLVH